MESCHPVPVNDSVARRPAITTSFEAVDQFGTRYVILQEITILAPRASSTRHYTDAGWCVWMLSDGVFEILAPDASGHETTILVTRSNRGTQ